ncbi:MAG TPA: VOC family protein [Polyangia bacterium]|nr:VOC family protein [Polyangia bacterium]
MAKKVKPIPEGYHTVTPYLTVKDAARAIDFYKKAFGAEETVRMPGPDGRIMHAELRIGNSMVMLADENPQMGSKSPQTLGGTAVGLMIYCDDADALFKRASAAGATVSQPLADMFWGDRFGGLKDPFGHNWSIATHIKDLAPAEMKKAQEAFFAQQAQKK